MREKRYQKPGIPPGTLTPIEGAIVPKSIRVIRYTPTEIQEAEVTSVEEVARLRAAGGVTWVDLDGLGNVELIRGLGHLFGLHPLALEDVLNVPQRPNLESYDDHLFIIMRMLGLDDGELQTEQVSLFLGRDFVVTFQERPGDCLDPVRDRLRKGTGSLRREGADFLAYAILDAVIDNYFPFLESYGEALEELEDAVVERPTRETLSDVHEAKRDLLNVRRCIWPLREVVNSLVRDDYPLISKNTRVFLRDCYQHTVYLLDMVETYRELASSLVDVYISSLSNKMNEVMKMLTIIATIFIPLTFVAGVYGMNFKYMPELNWPWSYPIVLVGMLGAAVLMLRYFRKKGWW